MPFDFTNKRVVVTGGSRGIGRAIALGFAGRRRRCLDLRAQRRRTRAHEGRDRSEGTSRARGDMQCCRRRRVRAYVSRGRCRAGRTRRAGQQHVGIRHGRRRSGLGGRAFSRHHGDGARNAGRAADAGALGRQLGHQHLVDLGLPAVAARAGICRGQGRDDQPHDEPGRDARAQRNPRQLHRARLDRVCGRRTGRKGDSRRIRSMRRCWGGFRSAASARRRRSPRWRCSWRHRMRDGSPDRRSPSTAGNCSADEPAALAVRCSGAD